MRTIFHEINRDGGSWAFADERGRNASEGACTFKHVRKGERAKEKAQEEMRKEKERERRSRSLKAKWPGCAPCITISLGKS